MAPFSCYKLQESYFCTEPKNGLSMVGSVSGHPGIM